MYLALAAAVTPLMFLLTCQAASQAAPVNQACGGLFFASDRATVVWLAPQPLLWTPSRWCSYFGAVHCAYVIHAAPDTHVTLVPASPAGVVQGWKPASSSKLPKHLLPASKQQLCKEEFPVHCRLTSDWHFSQNQEHPMYLSQYQRTLMDASMSRCHQHAHQQTQACLQARVRSRDVA